MILHSINIYKYIIVFYKSNIKPPTQGIASNSNEVNEKSSSR